MGVIMKLFADSGLGKEAHSTYAASNPVLFITAEKNTNKLKVRPCSTACTS